MPLPAPLVGLTIRGTLLTAAGDPLVGTVTLTPLTPAQSPAGDVLIGTTPMQRTISGTGTVEWVGVLASDSPGLLSPVQYRLQVAATGDSQIYDIELLSTQAVGGVLRLDDITPAIPSPGYITYLAAATLGQVGGPAGPLDANGDVPTAQLPNPYIGNYAVTGDLTIQGTGKAYRLRRGGAALDFEATGVDLLLSNWSGANFDGTQRSYDRYSADAANVQHAAKREYVASLYGAAVHTIDPTAGTASFGGKNGLLPIVLCGRSTSAGAPSSGTWTAGDVVLDSVGVWHLCTAGGTPGTWT